MSQEKKATIAPKIKSICAKYGIKATLSVHHHSSLCLNIKSGSIDFIGNYLDKLKTNPRVNYFDTFESIENNLLKDSYLDVNVFHFKDHFTGKAKQFLTEVYEAMNIGNFDHSDIQTDYFCVGWYTSIHIGRWNRPYVLCK